MVSKSRIKDPVTYKTMLCNKFPQCPYGDKCQFAHGEAELRVRYPRPRHSPPPASDADAQLPPPPPSPITLPFLSSAAGMNLDADLAFCLSCIPPPPCSPSSPMYTLPPSLPDVPLKSSDTAPAGLLRPLPLARLPSGLINRVMAEEEPLHINRITGKVEPHMKYDPRLDIPLLVPTMVHVARETSFQTQVVRRIVSFVLEEDGEVAGAA